MLKRIPTVVFVLLALSTIGTPIAKADEYGLSPASYAYAGVLVVNGTVALGNGISMALGNPVRANGQFGLVTGVATAILAGVLYGVYHEHGLNGQAAMVLGGAGLASAVVGWLTIRVAGKKDAAGQVLTSVLPYDRGVSVGLVVRF